MAGALLPQDWYNSAMSTDRAPVYVQVKAAHHSKYPRPIRFSAGDFVLVGRCDEAFPGWIWTTTVDGNSGWAPEALLEVSEPAAVAREAYNARELDTVVGESLQVFRSLAGWLWVRNAVGEEGWVPETSVTAAGSAQKPDDTE
jgi:hypothetical protein